MGNFFTNPQGRPDDEGFRLVRRRLVYNLPGLTSAGGVPIGAFEKGSVIVRAYACKNIVFSAGATLTLGNLANAGSGQTLNVASIMASADVAPQTAGMAMVGNNQNPGGAYLGYELPADTVLYAFLGGTAATAGDVTLIVEATPPYPWSDLNGGQAA